MTNYFTINYLDMEDKYKYLIFTLNIQKTKHELVELLLCIYINVVLAQIFRKF